MPDELPTLDGTIYLIHGDLERSEVGSVPVDLGEVSSRLVDGSDCSTQNPLRGTMLRLLFLQFALSLGGAAGGTPSNIFNLDVYFWAGKNASHFSDFMLHQIFVGVGDLHPIDECGGSYIVVAVIYQSHLALEILIYCLRLSGLHLDGKEVIVVLPQLTSGSVLVVEGLLHLPEVPE